jgi:plasmid stabilization system protein ParE
MKLVFSPHATRDLRSVSAYLLEHNPKAAIRVRAALFEALALIARHPRAGRAQEGGSRRYALPRYPYLIFYRVDDAKGIIGIVTIRHAARRP